jgi:hypothetical protein
MISVSSQSGATTGSPLCDTYLKARQAHIRLMPRPAPYALRRTPFPYSQGVRPEYAIVATTCQTGCASLGGGIVAAVNVRKGRAYRGHPDAFSGMIECLSLAPLAGDVTADPATA